MNDILHARTEAAQSRSKARILQEMRHDGPVHLLHGGRRYLHFSGNDYLGLRSHPLVVEASMRATEAAGAGSGGSRLVTGNHAYYAPLEQLLAAYKHTEAALVFGSGALANMGAISALLGKGDVIFADKLCHASMLDGAKLSGAKLLRFAHNDTVALARMLEEHRGQYRHALVMSESVFSMDGDNAPIGELARLAKAHDAWLLIDDAHGIAPYPSDAPQPDIWIGTLSKAWGSYGGYVAGSQALREYLVTHARSFMFSTALPPGCVAAAAAALRIGIAEPERAAQALGYARQLRKSLAFPEAQSAIVPVILGASEAALAASLHLAEAGIWVGAIRPPAVPPGTARLRVTLSAAHMPEHVEALMDHLQRMNLCTP